MCDGKGGCTRRRSTCRYFNRWDLFFTPIVCLVSSPHTSLFLLAAQLMMLQRWKTTGVIFTGGQGTRVMKLASFIFHNQKKNVPSPSPSLSKHKLSVGSLQPTRSRDVNYHPHRGSLTSDSGKTRRQRCDMMSWSKYFSVIFSHFWELTGSEGNPVGLWNNKQPSWSEDSWEKENPQHSSPRCKLPLLDRRGAHPSFCPQEPLFLNSDGCYSEWMLSKRSKKQPST